MFTAILSRYPHTRTCSFPANRSREGHLYNLWTCPTSTPPPARDPNSTHFRFIWGHSPSGGHLSIVELTPSSALLCYSHSGLNRTCQLGIIFTLSPFYLSFLRSPLYVVHYVCSSVFDIAPSSWFYAVAHSYLLPVNGKSFALHYSTN